MKKVFLIALLVLLSPTLSWAELAPCPEGTSPLREDHRVHVLLRPLQIKARVWNVRVCRIEEMKESQLISYFFGAWIIQATELVLDKFTEDALRGALAHELGHILLRPAGVPPKISRGVEDQQADAIAIKLVGEETLFSTYVTYTGNVARAQRRVARALEIIASNDRHAFFGRSEDMIGQLLVTVSCMISPSVIASGDVSVINEHLTEVVTSCYGNLGPEIRCTKVDVRMDRENNPYPLSASVYDLKKRCAVLTPGTLALETQDPDLVLASIGHEVGHIVIESTPGLHRTTSKGARERLADLVMIQNVPGGACTGLRFLTVIVNMSESLEPAFTSELREFSGQRTVFLQESCTAQLGLLGPPLPQ